MRVQKIECPFCHNWYSDVIGGYWKPDEEVYIRRRKCRGCGEVLETDEKLRSRRLREARERQKSLTPQDIAGAN